MGMKFTSHKVKKSNIILCFQMNLESRGALRMLQAPNLWIFILSYKASSWLFNRLELMIECSVFINQFACGQWVIWKESTFKDKIHTVKLQSNQFSMLPISLMKRVQPHSSPLMHLIVIISKLMLDDRHSHLLHRMLEIMRLSWCFRNFWLIKMKTIAPEITN